MPIYEYRCSDCGTDFEALQKIGAEPPPCEACESGKVQKLMSATSFVLKGGGWYKDGYSGSSNQTPDAKIISKKDQPAPSSSASGSSSNGSSSSSTSSSSTSSSSTSSSSTSSAAS